MRLNSELYDSVEGQVTEQLRAQCQAEGGIICPRIRYSAKMLAFSVARGEMTREEAAAITTKRASDIGKRCIGQIIVPGCFDDAECVFRSY